MIIDTILEEKAGYISARNEIYKDVPDYIKKMAEKINIKYQELYEDDFFVFIDKNSPYSVNLTEDVKNAREQVYKKYHS